MTKRKQQQEQEIFKSLKRQIDRQSQKISQWLSIKPSKTRFMPMLCKLFQGTEKEDNEYRNENVDINEISYPP